LNPIIAKENAKMDDDSAQQGVALSQIADKYLENKQRYNCQVEIHRKVGYLIPLISFNV